MFGEVIAAHESALAHRTHKLFLPGVRPAVPGELVGAGEPLIAAVPAAAERLLTYGGEEEVGKVRSQQMSHVAVIKAARHNRLSLTENNDLIQGQKNSFANNMHRSCISLVALKTVSKRTAANAHLCVFGGEPLGVSS